MERLLSGQFRENPKYFCSLYYLSGVKVELTILLNAYIFITFGMYDYVKLFLSVYETYIQIVIKYLYMTKYECNILLIVTHLIFS